MVIIKIRIRGNQKGSFEQIALNCVGQADSFGRHDHARFVGVFESVSVKYTMFMPGGRPVRATASVKLIEAERMESPKKKR